jgi:competence protein ComGC
MRLVLFVLALLLIMPSVFAQDKNNGKINSVKINSAQEQTDSKYTFDDNTMSGKVVKLEKGTELPISLVNPIDTSTAQENDVVEAFMNDKLEIDGVIVAEQGSIVKGKIIKARNGAESVRNGKVSVIFDKIITTDNKTIDITTKKIDFVVNESSRWITVARDFGLVLLTAALAVCSCGAGAGIVLIELVMWGGELCDAIKQGGSDVMIPALTPVEIAIKDSVNVIGNYAI